MRIVAIFAIPVMAGCSALQPQPQPQTPAPISAQAQAQPSYPYPIAAPYPSAIARASDPLQPPGPPPVPPPPSSIAPPPAPTADGAPTAASTSPYDFVCDQMTATSPAPTTPSGPLCGLGGMMFGVGMFWAPGWDKGISLNPQYANDPSPRLDTKELVGQLRNTKGIEPLASMQGALNRGGETEKPALGQDAGEPLGHMSAVHSSPPVSEVEREQAGHDSAASRHGP